jgi:hypothetical protein
MPSRSLLADPLSSRFVRSVLTAFMLATAGVAGMPSAAGQVYSLSYFGNAFVMPATDTSGHTSVEVTVNNAWNGTLLGGMFDYRDIKYGQAVDVAYRDTTFIGTAATPGNPVSMALAGVTTGLDPETKLFEASRLTFQGVDFHPQNVKLQFFGLTPSLNLDNAAIRFGDTQQAVVSLASAPFAITAAASTANTVANLRHQLGAATTVDVPAGARLDFLNCGSVFVGEDPSERLWFNANNNNIAVEGTLNLYDSYLIVRVSDDSSQKTGDFSVTNGGTLNLNGPNTVLQTNYLTVDSGTLGIGPNATLQGHATNWDPATMTQLALADATIVANQGWFSTNILNVSGTNSLTVVGDNSPSLLAPELNSLLMADAQSSLTITGSSKGDVYVGTGEGVADFWNFNGGTLSVTEGAPGAAAALHIGDQYEGDNSITITPDDANLVFTGSNVALRVGRNGTFSQVGNVCNITMVDGATIDVLGQGMFESDGTIAGTANETVSVAQSGHLKVLTGATTGRQMTVQTSLQLDPLSFTTLAIHPSTATADSIVVEGDFLLNSSNGFNPNLDLLVISDSVLAEGTKLMLFDYSATRGLTGTGFQGYADNSIFTLGLNSYQIRYSDPDYLSGTNPSVITLTVVPEPSSLALLAGGAIGGVAVMRRRRRKASSLASAA